MSVSLPYITPKLFHASETIGNIDTAIICYCPFPQYLNKYVTHVADKRYFIHSPITEVHFCCVNEHKFIVISEVYGGPVSATTVEELSYYGVKRIIGVGFAGGLQSGMKIGDVFFAESSFADDGTTCKYTDDEIIHYQSEGLNLLPQPEFEIEPKRVWTGSALYNETRSETQNAIDKGCQVVNMDTAHLYAISQLKGISSMYFGIVTDIHSDTEWVNGLSDIVKTKKSVVMTVQDMLLEQLIEKIVTINDRIDLFAESMLSDRDSSHGLDHCRKVTETALKINSTENDSLVIRAIAMFHDIYDHKYPNCAERKQSVIDFLSELFLPEVVKEIIIAIDSISFSAEKRRGMNWYAPLLSKKMHALRNIVSDADKLEALGRDGFERCKSFIIERSDNILTLTEEDVLLKVKEHCEEKLFVMEPYFRTDIGRSLCILKTKELRECIAHNTI